MISSNFAIELMVGIHVVFIQNFCCLNFSYYDGADVGLRHSCFTAVKQKHVILEVRFRKTPALYSK
jgi:hypothetical protein